MVVIAAGSGWSGTDSYGHSARCIDLARAGYVAVSIAYRGTFKDNVRFPAAVQDTLEAVRFLRANSEIFHVDTERVALLGDSSGGNTVAMAALAGNDPIFRIGENLEVSDKVKACVVFYGPMDLNNLVSDRIAEGKKLRPGEGEVPFEAAEIYWDDYKSDPKGLLDAASPINYVKRGMVLPKFLFFNGDDDPIIPMAQGDRFCKKLRECGGRAEFEKIAGALHGTGCW